MIMAVYHLASVQECLVANILKERSMESGYEAASAYTYKVIEVEIRSILLPRGTDAV